ncbi:subtilisin inhibitor CLSI-II-like [Vigna umbellata]|uniref:subtilisin inhibitor CLSI-II-like n=1 Tax=Vigna umbellata TaxID=87088 RepID=UPI001F5FC019|nr:subtilisin inhibitor CLSI-II-like [Vigna umbellata]
MQCNPKKTLYIENKIEATKHRDINTNMKCAISLTFPFLLFALASARFVDPPVPVVDSKGVPLSAAEEYYVTQLNSGPTASGLQPGVERDVKCPLIVMQDYNPAILGEKVKITIRGVNSKTIMTGTPLDIAFVNKPSCASSSKWVVVNEKQYSGEWLGIGGTTDLGADKKIVDGVFKIEKYLFVEGYKFVFCPSSSTKCFDFARREEKNGKRLILVNETTSPFIFEAEFVKAVKQKSSSFLF